MNIGAKINNLMKENSITQEILADYTDVSQSKIHEIISGKTQKVDFLFMHKVCEIFNVDFDYFLEDKNVYNLKKNIGAVIENNATVNITQPYGVLENIIERLENLEKNILKN